MTRKKSMAMATSNFNKLRAVSSELILRDPVTDEVVLEDGKPVTITMVGYNTKEYLVSKVEDARREAAFRDQFFDPETDRLRLDVDPEIAVDHELLQRAHSIAAHVIGWSHDEFFGGPFNRKAAVDFFAAIENVTIGYQVLKHRDEKSNFFPK